MTTIAWSLQACFLTPPWPDETFAPKGKAPYSHPSDAACARQRDPEAFEVDGFLFCAADAGFTKIPVDDPLYEDCSETTLTGDEQVLSLFDGAHAEAYRITAMIGRELVHTEWDGEPILVDF